MVNKIIQKIFKFSAYRDVQKLILAIPARDHVLVDLSMKKKRSKIRRYIFIF